VDITLREKLITTFNVPLSSPLTLEKQIGKHEAKTFQAFQAFGEHIIKKIQASNTTKLTVTLQLVGLARCIPTDARKDECASMLVAGPPWAE
jgi:hypothetical protein